jgi:hypothetical protein
LAVVGTFGNLRKDARDKYVFRTPLVVEISKNNGGVLLVTTQ